MNQRTLEQTLLEPLALLKQDAEECNAFFQAVSSMRYLQGSGGWGRPNSEIKAAEKQVDDFLAKWRVM